MSTCGLPVLLQRIVALVVVGSLASFVFGAGKARAGHLGCGETITQDAKLDSDLIDCSGDGIVIGADNITLDLNGHTIDGDGACCDLLAYGVRNGTLFHPTTGHDNVTIKGGAIRQFAEGVSLFGTRRNVLRALTVSDNSEGIRVHDADESVIDLSRIFANRRGIDLRGSGSNLIRNNAISGNGLGLSITQTNGDNVVERNSILGNDGGGMTFAFISSGTNRVVNNRLSRNGIVLLKAAGFEIDRNSISRAAVPALLLLEGHANRIARNSVVDSTRRGISLGNAQNDGNELIHNVVSRNGEDGIFIGSDNLGSLVRENLTNRNGDDGIDVDSATTSLTRNTASRNGDLGIEAVPGVVDGGGNRAAGNGNPLQCVSIVCS